MRVHQENVEYSRNINHKFLCLFANLPGSHLGSESEFPELWGERFNIHTVHLAGVYCWRGVQKATPPTDEQTPLIHYQLAPEGATQSIQAHISVKVVRFRRVIKKRTKSSLKWLDSFGQMRLNEKN